MLKINCTERNKERNVKKGRHAGDHCEPANEIWRNFNCESCTMSIGFGIVKYLFLD